MHQRCMMPVLFSLILSTVFNWNTKFVKPSLNKQETTHCEKLYFSDNTSQHSYLIALAIIRSTCMSY